MASGSRPAGTLYLVPAPLDLGSGAHVPLAQILPAGTMQIAARLEYWVSENAKTTRAYLKRVNESHPLSHPIQSVQIQELPKAVQKRGDYSGAFDAKPLIAPLVAGHDMGLVSEAGMPAIADPGASVVRAAHRAGAVVQALVGPSSLLMALAASGMNGQSFAFVGYLPQDSTARDARIRQLEGQALHTGQTQIFIETPYRNAALFPALLANLKIHTRLSVSAGVTMASAVQHSATVAEWRAATPAALLQALELPATYCLGA